MIGKAVVGAVRTGRGELHLAHFDPGGGSRSEPLGNHTVIS